MLIFHDLDKLAALSSHFMPFLIMWNIHWNTRDMPGRKEWGFYDPNQFEIGISLFIEYVITYIILYAIFATFYNSVLAIFWNKVKNYTFYTQFTERVQNPELFLLKTSKDSHILWLLFNYNLFHFVLMGLCAISVFPFIIFSKYAQTAYLFFVLWLVVKRGSKHYIDDFPSVYEKNLEKFDKYGRNYDHVGFMNKPKIKLN